MQINEPVLAIGLMSGASLDGIDAALIRTDGRNAVEPLHFLHVPYGDGPREMLRAAMTAALLMPNPAPHAAIDTAERALTMWHASAVRSLLEDADVAAQDVAVVGFPGQTLAHRPDRGWSWQIGDGAMLGQMTGIAGVIDFRLSGAETGVPGVPVPAIYHAALASRLERPVALLGIGDVTSVTWVGHGSDDVLAFDTGPGAGLIGDWVREQGGKGTDKVGAAAARGYIHHEVLTGLLDTPWFDAPPPKSLDPHDFGLAPLRGLSLEDGAATLAAFIVETIALARGHMKQSPTHWLVYGGGRHNDTIMNALNEKLGVPVISIDAMGVDGDAVDAQAYAYLAVRTVQGLPIRLP